MCYRYTNAGYHVAALFGQKVARERSTNAVFVAGFNEEVIEPKIGLNGFSENFSISSDVPDEMPMIFANHFRDFAAVYDFHAVFVDDL